MRTLKPFRLMGFFCPFQDRIRAAVCNFLQSLMARTAIIVANEKVTKQLFIVIIVDEDVYYFRMKYFNYLKTFLLLFYLYVNAASLIKFKMRVKSKKNYCMLSFSFQIPSCHNFQMK